MATVTNTIKLPDGTTPSYAAVVIELVASTTTRAAASPGAVIFNTLGGAGTTMYVKETGTGNTGWAAK